MNEIAASSSGIMKDQNDMQEFLKMLETQFKGSRCHLAQYETPKVMPQGERVFVLCIAQATAVSSPRAPSLVM